MANLEPSNVLHEPTPQSRAEVGALTSFGNTQEQIAAYLKICVDTLVKHYKHELATAKISANAAVANKLFRKATEENDITAQIFWLKTRAKWREKDPDETKKFESLIEKLVDKIAER